MNNQTAEIINHNGTQLNGDLKKLESQKIISELDWVLKDIEKKG